MGAQNHVICLDQGVKCSCEIFSLRLIISFEKNFKHSSISQPALSGNFFEISA